MLWAPRPLAADDLVDGFDCGKPSLNDWLARHARQAQASGSARAFAVVDDAQDGSRVLTVLVDPYRLKEMQIGRAHV